MERKSKLGYRYLTHNPRREAGGTPTPHAHVESTKSVKSERLRKGPPRPLLGWLALPALLLLFAPVSAQTPESPTAVIDKLVRSRWREAKVAPAPSCDDRAFARRLYLDLIGRIPTTEEAESFAADRAPGKRAALVDRLLASPEYARRMRDVFDVVFMGRPSGEGRPRRRGPGVGDYRGEWLAYLERAFAENRSWDRIIRDVLLARPATPEKRGAVWFLYARQERYQEIAEAVSPAVFGVQVQCAQCHDHPLASEIKQKHYWGLVAFFNRGKNRSTPAGPRVAESAVGGFSRYATLTGESMPSELAFLGAPVVPETPPAAGEVEKDAPELYRPAGEGPPSAEPPVPQFSRREQFVERVVQGNPLVARAAVNRLWALFMGRGLVHPVDRMDTTHPPSHPELLDRLAADFVRSGFDVKRLVRAILLSQAYQLDSRAANTAPELFARGLEKPLTAEALYRSLLVAATGKKDGEDSELREALTGLFPEVFPEENLSNLRQAMFLTNSPLVDRLIHSREGNTAERLAAISDPAARVREAFRVAYAREPAPDELKESTAYLAARADRPQQATAQLWWALLAGAEFRLSH